MFCQSLSDDRHNFNIFSQSSTENVRPIEENREPLREIVYVSYTRGVRFVPITPTYHKSQAMLMFSSQTYTRGIGFKPIKPINHCVVKN